MATFNDNGPDTYLRVHLELTPFDLEWFAGSRDFYSEDGELLVMKRQFGAAFKRDGRIFSVPAQHPVEGWNLVPMRIKKPSQRGRAT